MESINISIEKAAPDDHQMLTEITKKSKAHWKYSNGQMEKWDTVLTVSKEYISENETYKLISGNRIVGYYSFTAENDKVVKLDNMFVLPDYIRKGYGKIMMADFIERIGKTNARKIVLDAEPNAEMFYRKFGFKAMGNSKVQSKTGFCQ